MTLPSAALIGHRLGVLCEGVAFGAPNDWTLLAELSCLWVFGAFLAGALIDRWVESYRTVWASMTGVVLLISATFGYYANTPNQFPEQTGFWLVASVVAGVVFGACGALVRDHRWTVRAGAALAVSTGVLFDLPLAADRGLILTSEVRLVVVLAMVVPWFFASVPELTTPPCQPARRS